MPWKDFIVSDKNILLGKPIVSGTRISVELVLELLSSGWTEDMIFESYPQLTQEHLQAIFTYVKECKQQDK